MDFMQFQQPPRIQLEDFYDHHTDTIQVEKEVQQLGLKVTIQNRTDRIYQRAVENLKKLVPNLCEVSLYGGYGKPYLATGYLLHFQSFNHESL